MYASTTQSDWASDISKARLIAGIAVLMIVASSWTSIWLPARTSRIIQRRRDVELAEGAAEA